MNIRPVLVLSTYVETEYAVQLLEHGASGLGYLLKDRVDDAAGLYGALQRLVQGETVVDPDIVSKLLIRRRDSSPLDRLTGREHQILDLMAQGRTNAGISAVLFISPKTVEAGVASIFDKLQLRTAPDTNRRVLAVLTRLRADRGFG